jgi:shikimate kinase
MPLIILLGPKHSGKTSAGKALADLLDLPFFDLDALIETETGKSVRALYTMSQELFRRRESEALSALFEKQRRGVAAAGGGIVDNGAAMRLLAAADAVTVCLEVSSQCAWERIAAGELPPFLRAPTLEASRAKHRAVHDDRTARCRKAARFTVNGEGKTARETAAMIREVITKSSVL